MEKQVFNKLVRDKIPQIIRDNGEQPVTRQLDSQERINALLDKLVEEAMEVRDSSGSVEEFADLAQVQRELQEALQIPAEAIEAVRIEKEQKRGGFKDGTFLEYTET